MSKSDINGASFAYGINLLRLLLSMKLISKDHRTRFEYGRDCHSIRHREMVKRNRFVDPYQ